LELNANYIIIQERPKHIRNSNKLIVNRIAKVLYRVWKITTNFLLYLSVISVLLIRSNLILHREK